MVSINNKKIVQNSQNFETFLTNRGNFMLPLMTFEVILWFKKNLCLHNVSIHRNFYQNRFINEFAEMKKALL